MTNFEMMRGKKLGILVEGILASFSLEDVIIGLQKDWMARQHENN